MPTEYPISLPKDFNAKEWEIIRFPDPGNPTSVMVYVRHKATGICSRTIPCQYSLSSGIVGQKISFLISEVQPQVVRMLERLKKTLSEPQLCLYQKRSSSGENFWDEFVAEEKKLESTPYKQSEQFRWVKYASELKNPPEPRPTRTPKPTAAPAPKPKARKFNLDE